MYEVTSKMAADIHTKGFKNPLSWKRACMLINLLDPGDIVSKELLDMVSPTTNVDTTVRQVFQTKTNDVPNFPYTEIPILPPEVYQKGLSGKEQVQQLPGMDPILVVKTPTYFRKRPSGLSLPKDCLRSTWILTHGKWIKVEDRAHPVQQQDRFDQWVERSCFQYHQSNDGEPSAAAVWRSGQVSSRPPGVTRTTRACRVGAISSDPRPEISSTDHWSYTIVLPSIHWRPTHNHSCSASRHSSGDQHASSSCSWGEFRLG